MSICIYNGHTRKNELLAKCCPFLFLVPESMLVPLLLLLPAYVRHACDEKCTQPAAQEVVFFMMSDASLSGVKYSEAILIVGSLLDHFL